MPAPSRLFATATKTEGYGEAMRGAAGGSGARPAGPYFAGADNLVAGANRADIHTYLPDDLMVKVDVASMAHGLETRSPLLDHVLLEWAAALPVEVKMAGGGTKALFKSAMAPYLPREILHRRKMGFGCPIDQWLRHELKDLAYDTLLSPARARARPAAAGLRRAACSTSIAPSRAEPPHAPLGAADARTVVPHLDRRRRPIARRCRPAA